MSGERLLGVLPNELVVNVISEAVDHQALHLGFDIGAADPSLVQKFDPHPGRCVVRCLFRCDDPLHLALEDDGLLEGGHLELEKKLRIDIQGFVRLDERAAAADVPGVVREERVEASILYFQLDESTGSASSVFVINRQGITRFAEDSNNAIYLIWCQDIQSGAISDRKTVLIDRSIKIRQILSR